MPAVTSYEHGITMSRPSYHQRKPGKRGEVVGWSPGAVRRNIAFLRSVDESSLTGHGFAVTLTVGTCPKSSADWGRMVRAWIERQRRRGMIRLHWVMEFQRRGVPHLHCAIWYEKPTVELRDDERSDPFVAPVQPIDVKARKDWMDICRVNGIEVSFRAQFARPLAGPVGWFQYMAKHCSRGGRHYQRQRESLPAGWRSSGRVWGKRGHWVTIDPRKIHLHRQAWFRLRRYIRAWRVAEARRALPLNRRQVAYCRRMLKCGDSTLSEVRGLSEWVPKSVQIGLVRAAVVGSPVRSVRA